MVRRSEPVNFFFPNGCQSITCEKFPVILGGFHEIFDVDTRLWRCVSDVWKPCVCSGTAFITE